jgi:hypothetical protein
MGDYNTNYENGIQVEVAGTRKFSADTDGNVYVGGTLTVVGTIDTTGATDNLAITGTLAVTGATTATGLITANGGVTVPTAKALTVSSGGSLVLTGATITGFSGNITGYANGAAVSLDCTESVVLSAAQLPASTFIISAAGESKTITCTGMAVGKQFTVINDADTNDVVLTMGSGTTATSTHAKTAVFIVSAATIILKITVDA